MNALCRLCLRRSTGLLPIFKAHIGENVLTEMIWEAFRIKLDPCADLPKHVCQYCLKKIDHLHSFYQELIKCQSLLNRLKEKGLVKDRYVKYLIAAEIPQHHSDGVLEEVEMLEETITADSTENKVAVQVDEGQCAHKTESVENEGAEPEEKMVEEQLIDIKIEAVDEDDEFLIERLVEGSDTEQPRETRFDSSDEEFKGFDEFGPVKLEPDTEPPLSKGNVKQKPKLSNRKHKQAVPKLDIVETIPNKCYICNNVCENKDIFDFHLVTHKGMLPYECAQCSTKDIPIEIKTLVLLNKHFESHGFNYVCSHCPLRFRSYPPLYDHTRNAHAEHGDGFHCEVCGTMFNEIRKFQKHMRAHKNRQAERYKCNTCQKSFQTGTVLRRHERIHAKDASFVCPFCKRGFNHETNYQQHKMRHIEQQKADLLGYSCSVCDMHFTNASDRRVHMREHFPDDPMYTTQTDILPARLKDMSSYPRPCEEADCKYVAPSYQLMWSHYRNHYKMYQCQECGRKFATATILKTHIDVIHKKIRKFQCEFCLKKFAYQHKYKEHVNVHKGIKARHCRYCDKTFTHSSNLIVHERIHTKSRPYKCDVCGSTHVTTSALKKHKKTHQKKTQPIAKDEQEVYEEEDLIYVEEVEDTPNEVAGEEEVIVKDLVETLEDA